MNKKNIRIILAGGNQEYLIESFIASGYQLTVINESRRECEYLAQKYHTPKFVYGNPSEIYTLTDAGINNADILVALCSKDEDNLMICQAAKRLFDVRRVVAVVANPKNIDIFKKLGTKTVISAAHTVANIIEQASIVGDLVNTLSVQDEAVIITKVTIKEESPVINKKIQDIKIPKQVIISCVIRETGIVIPNGQTHLMNNDRLLIMSEPSLQGKIIEMFTGNIQYES